MKVRAQVTAEKLRGGFYTPPALVRHALQRVRELAPPAGDHLRVLEPSSGDGAFIAGIAGSGLLVRDVTAIELIPSEAQITRQRMESAGLPGEVLCCSTLAWGLHRQAPYDVVVGNLPFVRFQFVDAQDRDDALVHAAELGVDIGGVANLWLPMLLAAMRHLRQGGIFSLVLPAECFTGVSAGRARAWLLSEAEDLRCDLFPAGSFPGVLQEVVLVSGRRVSSPARERTVALAQHSGGLDDPAAGPILTNVHTVPVAPTSWTNLLLSPSQQEAVREFSSIQAVGPLKDVARLGVAAVTGANDYFSLSSDEIERYGLSKWARPLLPRIRHARGLRFTEEDHQKVVESGVKAYLFDLAASPDDPLTNTRSREYIAVGESHGLHERYKCRIREPWFAVPHIKHGDLLLSKRSHRFPRMILNRSAAVTTDTIYCGHVTEDSIAPEALVAGFLNSGTLLSAELEGRNFGGGVLELVPSEVGRLMVPRIPELAGDIDRLDAIFRESATPRAAIEDQELVVRETDLLLVKADVGIQQDLMEELAAARSVLLERRLDRTQRANDGADTLLL